MDYATYENKDMGFSAYLTKCFLWMFIGLLVSFSIGYASCYTNIFNNIFMGLGNRFILIMAILEIVLVISLVASIGKLSTAASITLFLLYSAVNGFTLSSIFYYFELTSIVYVFLASAFAFGLMALVGYTTKLDLSKLRNFITISLISMLLVGILLMFYFNNIVYTIYSVAGLGLFMIITTYDIHIIKRMYYEYKTDEQRNCLAIYGALQLYLDFINIFIHLASLFGRLKDD